MNYDTKKRAFATHIGCHVVFLKEDGTVINGLLAGVTDKLLTDLLVIEEMDNGTVIKKEWCSSDSRLVLRDGKDISKEELKSFFKCLGMEDGDKEFYRLIKEQKDLLVSSVFDKNADISENNIHPLKMLEAYDGLRAAFLNLPFMGYDLVKENVAILK